MKTQLNLRSVELLTQLTNRNHLPLISGLAEFLSNKGTMVTLSPAVFQHRVGQYTLGYMLRAPEEFENNYLTAPVPLAKTLVRQQVEKIVLRSGAKEADIVELFKRANDPELSLREFHRPNIEVHFKASNPATKTPQIATNPTLSASVQAAAASGIPADLAPAKGFWSNAVKLFMACQYQRRHLEHPNLYPDFLLIIGGSVDKDKIETIKLLKNWLEYLLANNGANLVKVYSEYSYQDSAETKEHDMKYYAETLALLQKTLS